MANNAFPTPPPFAQQGAQTAPQAAPQPNAQNVPQAAPQPNAQDAPQAAPQTNNDDSKKSRSTVNISNDHIQFVLQNVKNMSYQDMADHLNISKNQVNRILQGLKKGLREDAIAKDPNAYYADPAKTNKDGSPRYDYNKPQTDYAKKVEQKIEGTLSRPESARVGGGGGGQSQQALDNKLEELLNSL